MKLCVCDSEERERGVGVGVIGIPIDKKLLSTIIKMLIDKPFSRVLVIIQLLIRRPSYQPTIDNEDQIINR